MCISESGTNTGIVTVVMAWQGINEVDQTLMDDPNTPDGTSLGECGDGLFNVPPGTGDRLRRQLVMSTFVAEF